MQKAVVPSEQIGRWIDVAELERESHDASPGAYAFRRETVDEQASLPSTHPPQVHLRYRPFEVLASRFSRAALGATT
jgi:hypothetical protein